MRNPLLLRIAVAGAAMFFTFVGVFSYVVFRLQRPPFDLGPAAELAHLPVVVVRSSRYRTPGNSPTASAGAAPRSPPSYAQASGCCFPSPRRLPTLAVGLSLVTLAMFAGVTALQLGVTSATDVDRGAASAVYFSIYYGCGAVGGYLPGLAWQAWRWNGVAGVGLAAVSIAALRAAQFQG